MKNQFVLLPAILSLCVHPSRTEAQPKGDSASGMRNYSITSGDVSMTVDPAAGGRIVSFKLRDYEFLVGKDVHPENYGSTFWPSPQSYWNWPPPPVLDSENYSVAVNDDSVQLTSGKDTTTGFQFIKEFRSGKRDRMRLTYSIVNTSGEIKKAAPWEITRVHKGGLLFFPVGEGTVGKKFFDPAPTKIIDGVVWYQGGKERPKQNELTITDGSEGWAAYAIDGRVFVKKFRDIKPDMQAPGEAEVLFYVSAEANYVEFEIQGEYVAIRPGGRSTWDVQWIAAALPSAIEVEIGNRELVEFVRELVR